MEINLKNSAGNIDIYLLDQMMKGRFHENMRLLDAGCGRGRNLIPLVRNGAEAYGIDRDEAAIGDLKRYVYDIDSNYPMERFMVGNLNSLPFEESSMDGVISNAVLHFADNHEVFHQMFSELVRVLRKGGVLFCRTATSRGIESSIGKADTNGWRNLPDGSRRYVCDSEMLKKLAEESGCCWLEPFKTVVVDNLRSMSTLVLRKER